MPVDVVATLFNKLAASGTTGTVVDGARDAGALAIAGPDVGVGPEETRVGIGLVTGLVCFFGVLNSSFED